MNPPSNLILTVRLTREVTMNKTARARQKFIHCVHLHERFLKRERKKRSEGFGENSEPRERKHSPSQKTRSNTEFMRAAKKLRRLHRNQ